MPQPVVRRREPKNLNRQSWIVFTPIDCFVYRQSDRYYNDIMMMPDGEVDVGIENTRLEPYEYTDQPKTLSIDPRTNSTATLRSTSAVSLKELQTLPSSSPNGETKTIGASKMTPRTTNPQIVHFPQTDV